MTKTRSTKSKEIPEENYDPGFLIIPCKIRNDRNVSYLAKLIYGEIVQRMTNNQADLFKSIRNAYGITDKTIYKCMDNLAEAGHMVKENGGYRLQNSFPF